MGEKRVATQDFFRRHKHWWVVALVVAFIAGAVGALVSSRTYKSESQPTYRYSCEGSVGGNDVGISATIIAVDTSSLVATLRLDFTPHGNLVKQVPQDVRVSPSDHKRINELLQQLQDANTLTDSMTLTTTGLLSQPSGSQSTAASTGAPSYVSASSSYAFLKGEYMQDVDVAVPLEGGSLSAVSQRGETDVRYPWDSYTNASAIQLQLRRGVGVDGPYLPSCVTLTSSVGGWSFNARSYDVNNAFDISLSRSAPVKWYSYFVMGLMWALAVGGVAMAVIMLMRKQDEIDTAAFAYLAALLFAFPLIRQTLPGDPGPGSFVDLYAYYWTEVIVATTLVVLLLRWITLKGRHDREIAHVIEEERAEAEAQAEAADQATVDSGG